MRLCGAIPALSSFPRTTTTSRMNYHRLRRDQDQTVQPGDWVDEFTPHKIVFEPGSITDTTQAAINLLANSDHQLEQQYYSQKVAVSIIDRTGILCPLPAFAFEGVRVLYQKGAGSRYASRHVLMAVPTSAVRAIARKLILQGVKFGGELMQDEMIRTLDGIDYCVFTVSISKTTTLWSKDGQETAFELGAALKGAKKDLIANVAFKVSMKYRGLRGIGKEPAPKAIKLEPFFLVATDVSSDALDPTGPVRSPPPSPSKLGNGFAPSRELADLLGGQAVPSQGHQGRQAAGPFPGEGKLLR